MTEKLEIPMGTKYKFVVGGYHSILKGYLELIRDEYGADASLKLYEKLCKQDDRIKNFTNIVTNVFKLEGNDAETIAKWFDIWHELTGIEGATLEQSKTFSREKITKCPWKTDSKDISNWCSIFMDIVYKTINPKATFERPKSMCAGDPYCEFVSKIEE